MKLSDADTEEAARLIAALRSAVEKLPIPLIVAGLARGFAKLDKHGYHDEMDTALRNLWGLLSSRFNDGGINELPAEQQLALAFLDCYFLSKGNWRTIEQECVDSMPAHLGVLMPQEKLDEFIARMGDIFLNNSKERREAKEKA